MTGRENPGPQDFAPHRLPWSDIDSLARGEGGAAVVRKLREAERSRRLLLLRALFDFVTKTPESLGPLPPPEIAWELLARVERNSPAVLDLLLAHPYTGSWAGYTTRLCRDQVTGVCPLWMHLGHLHALAATAGIRAGLPFRITIPLWEGGAILPTLGLARFPAAAPCSVAEVRSEHGVTEVRHDGTAVRLPGDHATDASGWWGIRGVELWSENRALSLRLDDVDPYRGLYEPARPRRLGADETQTWRDLLGEAWRLIVRHLPGYAEALPEGLDSLVPGPPVPFRLPSASTGEAFGSAIVGRAEDPVSLAAALIHEFQHIQLGGLLHLARLTGNDSRERFYAPWRNDPRPAAGLLQGIYAFFGVTAFWRSLAHDDAGNRLAAMEFALSRAQCLRSLQVLREDPVLTSAGRRFLDGVAARLRPWQDEPVTAEQAGQAAALAADHYAGWRLCHLRPDPATVAGLAAAWTGALRRPRSVRLGEDNAPTPVPDGTWPDARPSLLRLRLGTDGRTRLAESWQLIPGAIEADFAYADGRFHDAADGYRSALAADADRPSAWAGLGLALSALGTGPAARALLHRPELVRAVHRELRDVSGGTPRPEDIAAWIGRFTH
ncbi:HEXXH motif domain-containing protein [Amycolatopsis sp. H20-H5]|uniref:HEXXH motif domain-containing protein n=1 Tax=Amycolatopsis sp. H20-H5 TaxID=3046309 RepID=UPI002DB636EA|nr:HEXXH motif domain-containing protein [Amycolatopsis sp. H20-H5]MEC3977828.1 HEXXH motif domain-containing protein [Amycolatopsis sp. H20-H5]